MAMDNITIVIGILLSIILFIALYLFNIPSSRKSTIEQLTNQTLPSILNIIDPSYTKLYPETINTPTLTLSSSAQSYENISPYDHSSQTNSNIIYYGPNNSTAIISKNNGVVELKIMYGNGETDVYIVKSTINNQIIFVDMNNANNSAVLTTHNNNYKTLTVYSDGKTLVFNSNSTSSLNNINANVNDYDTIPANTYSNTDDVYILKPNSNTSSSSNGIPKYQIPFGKEDLYILKSEIVPPICPVCPSPLIINNTKSNDSNNNVSKTTTTSTTTTSTPTANVQSNPTQYSANYNNQNNQNNQYNQQQPPVQNYQPSINTNETNSININTDDMSGGGETGSGNVPVPVLNSFTAFGM